MANIAFEVGEIFQYKDGYGVTLSDQIALLLEGRGGRTGYKIQKGSIPKSAVPPHGAVPAEIRFVHQAVAVVIDRIDGVNV